MAKIAIIRIPELFDIVSYNNDPEVFNFMSRESLYETLILCFLRHDNVQDSIFKLSLDIDAYRIDRMFYKTYYGIDSYVIYNELMSIYSDLVYIINRRAICALSHLKQFISGHYIGIELRQSSESDGEIYVTYS